MRHPRNGDGMMLAERLDKAVRARIGEALVGVSIGKRDDKRTWNVQLEDEATVEQRAAAQAVIDVFDPAAGDPASVKAEAARRILVRYPEWKQRNMTARGVELLSRRLVAGAWTEAEAAEATTLQAAWDWIKSVRAAADALEALSPIPAGFADDSRWPS
jgi:hypothetical protein